MTYAGEPIEKGNIGFTPADGQGPSAAALLEDPDDPAGKELQQGFGDGVNILGAHPCFDALIDHPSWIGHIETFIGGADRPTFTGASCIIRWPGQASRLHSGGHMRTTGTQYVYHAGEFRCGDINIMLALNDCPLGGGGTALVPGSHKSNVEMLGIQDVIPEP